MSNMALSQKVRKMHACNELKGLHKTQKGGGEIFIYKYLFLDKFSKQDVCHLEINFCLTFYSDKFF